MACGRFNIQPFDIIIFFTWQYCLFTVVSDDLFPVFLNYEPQWRCVRTDGDTDHNYSTYTTHWSSNCFVLESCNKSENAFLQVRSDYFSAVQEWSMLCGTKALYANLVTTIQCLGYVFGALVGGHVSDHYGRKPVLTLLTLGCIVFGTCMSLAPNWQILAVLRFIMGFLCTGVLVVGNSYTGELVKTEQRFFLMVLFNWNMARFLSVICCHLSKHWRSSVVLIHLLEVPLLITVLILPESVIWLEEKGKTEELEKAKKFIAKINGEARDSEQPLSVEVVSPPPPKNEENNNISGSSDQPRVYTIKDLFSTKYLVTVTLTMCFLHVAYALLIYLLDLNSGKLPGNLFMNQYIIVVTIALTKPLGVLIDTYSKNFSRRLFHQIPTGSACVCFIAATVATVYHAASPFIIGSNLIGTVFADFIWDSLLLITLELYPTPVRSIGFGFVTVIASFGSMSAPPLLYLGKFWKAAPFAEAAIVSFLSLLVSCSFLPETKGKDLDTDEYLPAKAQKAAIEE